VSSSPTAITSDKYKRMWNGSEMVEYPGVTWMCDLG
jgi:hypothetical protein